MASHSASPFFTPPEEDPSTHAGHNPSQPQQEIQVLTKHSLSLSQKATHSLCQISDHAKAEELAAALDILLSSHHTELEDLAKVHNMKLEYICEGPMDIVCSKTIDREVNLFILYAITEVNLCTR